MRALFVIIALPPCCNYVRQVYETANAV